MHYTPETLRQLQNDLTSCFAVKMSNGGVRRLQRKVKATKNHDTPTLLDPLQHLVALVGKPGSQQRINAYRDSVTQDGPDGRIGLLK